MTPTEPALTLGRPTGRGPPARRGAPRRRARPRVPAMPPRRSHTERGPGLGRGLVAARTAEVWVAEAAKTSARLRRRQRTTGWTRCTCARTTSAGIGSALLELVKALRPGGFALWVFESNEPARAFYRSHGLVELEHTDGSANEERAPDLQMAWPGATRSAFLRAGSTRSTTSWPAARAPGRPHRRRPGPQGGRRASRPRPRAGGRDRRPDGRLAPGLSREAAAPDRAHDHRRVARRLRGPDEDAACRLRG